FTAEHNSVRTFINCVSNVAHFCASGGRILNHRLKQVRSDNHGLSLECALTNHLALAHGKITDLYLYAQITASDHNSVGLVKDLIEVFDAFVVFDLCVDASCLAGTFE